MTFLRQIFLKIVLILANILTYIIITFTIIYIPVSFYLILTGRLFGWTEVPNPVLVAQDLIHLGLQLRLWLSLIETGDKRCGEHALFQHERSICLHAFRLHRRSLYRLTTTTSANSFRSKSTYASSAALRILSMDKSFR